jgi:hypothetical protein
VRARISASASAHSIAALKTAGAACRQDATRDGRRADGAMRFTGATQCDPRGATTAARLGILVAIIV